MDVLGDELPSSSYRLGVRAAPLHHLLPSHLTHALKEALVAFDKQVSNTLTALSLFTPFSDTSFLKHFNHRLLHDEHFLSLCTVTWIHK